MAKIDTRRAGAGNLLKRAASRLARSRYHQIADLLSRLRMRRRATPEKTYEIVLPEGFGAARARIRLCVPKMPGGHVYAFSEDGRSEAYNGIDRVVACTRGGFAYSEDRGLNWKAVRLKPFARFPMVRSRLLPNGEILLVAADPDSRDPWADRGNRLIVADLLGNILHAEKMQGPGWHGPRAVDVSGETLMYAEYPWNGDRDNCDAAHIASRVWRSRDFGRSWHAVFEQKSVRHFHYLQARPGVAGEWWLTSGDAPAESRIWKSSDDGDTWIDQTDTFGSSITIGDCKFSRSVFRLTDLVWAGDDIIWGSDDALNDAVEVAGGFAPEPSRGSRLFRADPSRGIAPTVLGLCGPEVRNIVDVGKFYVVMTQSSPHFANNMPRVFLLSKPTADCDPVLVHLFDIDRFSNDRSAFTSSIASRCSGNGVFFTYRRPTDVFRAPDRILRWQVEFE